MSLISIIVPVYNAERTLRQCVDSILSQEMEDFELVLVDDGSRDASPVLCDAYASQDGRVCVVHQQNGGVSAARNAGLDMARGEWVTFIDSDDYVTEGYFNGVAERHEDLLVRGYRTFNGQREDNCLTAELIQPSETIKAFLEQFVANSVVRCPWAKFYKRTLIADLRFLTDMKVGEDAWFVFRYLSRCHSYGVLTGGQYVVRVAEEPDEVKYAVTVDYAVRSLQHLQDAFVELAAAHALRRSLFFPYIGYFKRISKNDWSMDKRKWYGDERIKKLYRYVWPDLSLKQKSRLLLAILTRR